jgi:flagellar hook-basal body complex protein FliE
MLDAIASLAGAVGAAKPLETLGRAIAGADAAPAPGAQSFGQVLAELSSGAIDSLKRGEAAAISGLQGNAPIQQVVEAVMEAERSLQTAIAIRDKVVAAYQELSRMTI